MVDEDRDRLIRLLHGEGQSLEHIAEHLGICIYEAEAAYARDLQRVTALRAEQYIVWAVQAHERVRQLEADRRTAGCVWRQSLALYRQVAQEMTAEAQRLNPGWEPPR